MEVGAPFLLDELGEAPGGPQLGGEAVLGRVLGQPAPDDLLLGAGQLGRATGHGPCRQGVSAVAAESSEPAAHAAGIDAEEFGDLSRGVAVMDPLDGETTAVFQDLGGAGGSHARRLSRRWPRRALLSSEAIATARDDGARRPAGLLPGISSYNRE
jgi:hypothetical protein